MRHIRGAWTTVLSTAAATALLVAGSATPALAADPVPVTTTTTLTSSAPVSAVGQTVTLTATVTGGSPTGDVRFTEGSTELGQETLSDGTVTLTHAFDGAGVHTLTATYEGDPGHAGSSATLEQLVTVPVPVPVPPVTSPVAAPVSVAAPVKAPTVRLRASATKVSVGDLVRLTWRARGADSVVASGAWSGSQKSKGSATVRITDRGKHVFRILVTNAGGQEAAREVVAATRKAKAFEVSAPDALTATGTTIEVLADGLAAAEPYTIRLAGAVLASGKADPKGDVRRTVVVPKSAKEGALALTVTGSHPARTGETLLQVVSPTKQLTVEVANPTVEKAAEQVVTVTGLAPGEAVTLTYAGKELVAGKADGTGRLEHTFTVGKKLGERTVAVVGMLPGRTGEVDFEIAAPANQGTVDSG